VDLKRDKFSAEIRRAFLRFLTCWEWKGYEKSAGKWWD